MSKRAAMTFRSGVCASVATAAYAPGMFAITEAEAAAIRAAFEQSGELSAVVELRRLFPGVTDNAQARECVRTIAGWRPTAPAASACPGSPAGPEAVGQRGSAVAGAVAKK